MMIRDQANIELANPNIISNLTSSKLILISGVGGDITLICF